MQPELITRYTDALGAEREAPAWAVTRVEELLASVEATGDVVEVHRLSPGQPTGPLAGRTLTLEDGATVLLGDVVPDDLPIGYHSVDAEGGTGLVLHAPRRVPAARRGWVLAAQLYAARSKRSWGQGDLRDARTLATWAREAGDGLLMINPLHAAIPGTDPQPSPYFASTRVFREPLYLAVDEVPGPKRRDLRTAQREALDGTDRIDRRRAWSAKRSALVARWPTASADPATVAAIDRWLTDDVNARYAAFCVERDPRDVGADPRFHAWLQLLVDEQVLAVGGNLVNDVAVGVDRAGADVAMWPDCFVDEGTRIGCPPDQFNTLGQDWGLPPLHPVNLRARGYEPFVRAVRAAAHGAAGIRLDHVMALDRTFWIPEGASPADGVYVKYPLDEMLDVVAIEAHRAQHLRRGRRPGHGAGVHPRGPRSPRHPLVPGGVARLEPPLVVPGAHHGRGHHPRPAHDGRAAHRQRPRRPATTRPVAQRRRHLGGGRSPAPLGGLGRLRPRRGGAPHPRDGLRVAGRPRLRHPRRPGRHPAPTEHARHHRRVAQLADPAPRAPRRDPRDRPRDTAAGRDGGTHARARRS
ncbi:MAG: 4-alpha-glucanotransferase [Acidimicrobiales bacterium]